MDYTNKSSEEAKHHGINISKLPTTLDMAYDSITENVKAMNLNCKDERMKFVIDKLVDHLHDFVRETSLTTEEWMVAINFLAETGRISVEKARQEFDILSGVLGITTLVDFINNGKPPGATEATVLGPFFMEDAHEVQKGDTIASEGKGDYMYVEGRVLDIDGNAIPNATLDTWEADGDGLYDVQYENLKGSDCRGRLRTSEDGSFAFRAVVPIPYQISADGPAARLVLALGRHTFRPAHLHVVVTAPGYESVTTQLYFKGDPYLTSDVAFGVKSTLIVSPETIEDLALSKSRGFKEAKPHVYVKRDFVLATPDQGGRVRLLLSKEKLEKH